MADTTFFYPNCCHVCKRWDINLISCPKCQMIFYCNEKHQQEHFPQHKEICAAIKRVLEDKKYMNTEEISPGKWLNIREEYFEKVSGILERKLKNEENDMFLYPKACMVCYRQDTIIRCMDCPSAAFCDKHRDDSEHREKYCKLLKECFEIDKYLTLPSDIDISYVNCLSDNTVFHDMDSFLNTYLSLDNHDKYLRMLHSNLVTFPLTVYFCIQKLDYLNCKTLSIHIVGTDIISRPEEIKLWKMLLILIPTLTTLTITFIQIEEPLSKCDMPTEVVWKTKKLVANVRCMLYAEYKGTTEFKKPNFIVEFDTFANNRCPTDKYEDICALAEKMCPCILVFVYIGLEHLEMQNQIHKYFFVENPFMNHLVRRNFITQTAYYPRSYLITLNDSRGV